ncbi:MAG: hypothetical protein JWQ35_1700, partial [Bacteriovoracaceae bacterium]|nr:hypothetical protein [Bacteriovoracaceae bacterium]
FMSQGKAAYDQLKNADGAIFTEESISPVDKDWISSHLFQGKFLSSFKKTFEGEKSLVLCSN